MPDAQSLSDLDYNNLWQATAEKERDIFLRLSVFRGSITFAVFDRNKTGGPVFKTPNMPATFINMSKILLNDLVTAAPGKSYTCRVNDKWDPETKKMLEVGTLTYGIDNQNNPYIGISTTKGLSYKFPIRGDLKYDWSGANLDRKIMNQAALMSLSTALSMDAVIASKMTSFKRDPNQQGGGNRGGGNRGGYGGGNRGGGGGNYNNNDDNNSRGGRNNADIEDSIPF